MRSLRQLEQKLFDRINPLVRFSVTRYVLSIGIFVGLVVFGLLNATRLGVDLLPSVNIPVVVVTTRYPGATPAVIDEEVTQPIEQAVSTLSGLTDINSTSSTGLSRVVLRFDPSTDQNSDANQVAAQIGKIVGRLPSGAQTPLVQTFDPNAQPILQFGLSGGAASLASVDTYAENVLVPELQRLPGVANVQLDGGPSQEFQVLLNPSKLAYYHLTPQQVTQAITNSAVSQPIGSITTSGNTLSFATQNQPTNLQQIAQILVSPTQGITVGQVAEVREAAIPPDYTRVNGQPVILVSIQQTPTSNAVAVAQAVRAFLRHAQLPPGYRIIFSNDTTQPILASIQSTYRELFITALVVAFVVLLFLGRLNTAFSVILAIPIALSAAPTLYSILGFTFNEVSLLALVVAIGIVVDDSIVVAENVERYRSLGLGRMEAVLRGASEVFGAVAAASLSLIAVLIPVSLIGGFIGRYLQQFALGLAAAVFFSWFEALLFLTVRMAYTPDSQPLSWRGFAQILLRPQEALAWGWRAWRCGLGLLLLLALLLFFLLTHRWLGAFALLLYPLALGLASYLVRVVLGFLEALTATLHAGTEWVFERSRQGYARLLERLLSRSVWVLAITGVLFIATFILIAPKIPFNFVPTSDNSSMTVNLRFPSGTPIEVTNRYVGTIEDYLLSQPYVRTVQTVVGAGGIFAGGNAPNIAQMVVRLTPVGTRPSVFELAARDQKSLQAFLRDQPSARVFISAGQGFQGNNAALSLDITSPNLNLLTERNAAILQLMRSNPYVLSADSSLSQTSLENDFVPNPAELAGTGITPSQIASALFTYTSGSQAGSVDVGGLSYPIVVQANPQDLSGIQSLLSLPIYSPTLNTTLHIGQLGSFVLNEAPLQITRYNRLYTAEYSLNLTPDAPPPLAFENQLRQQLERAGLLNGGLSLTSGNVFGIAALSRQLSGTATSIFLISLLLVYLVMGAQFNSFRYPIYLLLPVPLAIAGALWFIGLFGVTLDIFGVMGMLLLIGLSAKNAILYLDFVVERLDQMSLNEALVESARLRLRPIAMTTITVLVISFPLVLSRGAGAEFGQGLGVVMFGGIVVSAILTLFVVPAAFYLFERGRIAAKTPEPLAEQYPKGA